MKDEKNKKLNSSFYRTDISQSLSIEKKLNYLKLVLPFHNCHSKIMINSKDNIDFI